MIEHILPPPSRSWLALAALALLSALLATKLSGSAIWLCAFAVLLLICRAPWAASVAGTVVLASVVGAPRFLDPGEFTGEVTMISDSINSPYGLWALARVGGARVFLDMPSGPEVTLGDRINIDGVVRGGTTTRSGREMSTISVRSYERIGSSDALYIRLGNRVRAKVRDRLLDGGSSRGLLAGFLVGDTSQVDPVTLESMRSAGLSHFVAVSGSNVALYLGLIFGIALVLGVGPKRRAAAGLLALPIFVVATRFEPSVVRAAVMASLVLSGTLIGYRLEVWQVVSVTVIGLAIFDPWLVATVGFQLSLFATCGVIVGSRWPTSGGWGARSLLVTGGAQVAVAPLILLYFDTVPLLGALTNLVSAPLVAGATTLAVVGVIGVTPLVGPASWLASAVIGIADSAATWPQVEVGDLWIVAVVGTLTLFGWGRRRDLVLLGLSLVVLIAVAPLRGELEPGQVAVLDVGQGDAILLAGGQGTYALVDGGADPSLLVMRLRELGVRRLALVVATHGDADHAMGLTGLFGRFGIGEIWMTTDMHQSGPSDAVLDRADLFHVGVVTPVPGDFYDLGEIRLEVIGPMRRYASANDQSIVIMVTGTRRSMLLTGDIEVAAQRDLVGVKAEILKVPHHGAGTSDARWLASVGANQAVISVGENSFGHPVDWVLESLETSGASVDRTDLGGTVVIDLGD